MRERKLFKNVFCSSVFLLYDLKIVNLTEIVSQNQNRDFDFTFKFVLINDFDFKIFGKDSSDFDFKSLQIDSVATMVKNIQN